MEKYETVKDIGKGNYAVVKLVRHKETKHLFAVKYILRGHKIDERVSREIINHRCLRHPNIIQFKEVVLTPTHIAIIMEYAAHGDMFDYVSNKGILNEDEARYFFQQLISGVNHCHDMEICHRDLKLENTLLDGNQIKISDFGYSKSYRLHSRPNSMIGTPAYIAPEIFSGKEYDGKLADVWSCGVILYIMLVGELPFGGQKDLQDFKKTMNRISMREMKSHPWLLKNWPKELTKGEQEDVYENSTSSLQSIEEIMNIVEEAKTLPATSSSDQMEDLAEALRKI